MQIILKLAPFRTDPLSIGWEEILFLAQLAHQTYVTLNDCLCDPKILADILRLFRGVFEQIWRISDDTSRSGLAYKVRSNMGRVFDADPAPGASPLGLIDECVMYISSRPITTMAVAEMQLRPFASLRGDCYPVNLGTVLSSRADCLESLFVVASRGHYLSHNGPLDLFFPMDTQTVSCYSSAGRFSLSLQWTGTFAAHLACDGGMQVPLMSLSMGFPEFLEMAKVLSLSDRHAQSTDMITSPYQGRWCSLVLPSEGYRSHCLSFAIRNHATVCLYLDKEKEHLQSLRSVFSQCGENPAMATHIAGLRMAYGDL